MSGTRLEHPVPKIHLAAGYTIVAAGSLGSIHRWIRRCAALESADIDTLAELAASVPESHLEAIVVRRGELWILDGDGVALSASGPQAIGSGSDVARGYLGASPAPRSVAAARRLALRALGFVATVYVCEGPPFETRTV